MAYEIELNLAAIEALPVKAQLFEVVRQLCLVERGVSRSRAAS